jgi:hypothetical protein
MRQRGVALLIVLLVLVVGAGYTALRGLNAAYAKPERDARTFAAMQAAKQALLGYAANRARLVADVARTSSPSPELYELPGVLPCPAQSLATTNTLFGTARGSCTPSLPSFPNLLVGRLPWKTLDLPELTDSSGEPLWYAVSQNFRLQTTTPAAVNPNSQGTIRLVDAGGNVTQNRIVAVIMAPGPALAGQVRGSTTEKHTAANYLERFTVMPVLGIDFDFYAGRPTDAPPAPFNDYILTITEAELFDAIENGVAARLEQTIVPLLEAHRAYWGTLPYATGSFDPTQPVSSLYATNGALSGHLPVASIEPSVDFTTPTKESGTAPVSCTGGSDIDCMVGTFGSSVAETFVIRTTLRNVNGGVFQALEIPTVFNLSMSVAVAPITSTLDADVLITGTVTGRRFFSIERPRQRLRSAAPSATLRPEEYWFDYGNWARFVYYSRCSDAGTTCITVEQPGTAAQPARAVLVSAGRAVMKPTFAQQARPSVNPAEYFEAPHDTLPTTAFRRQLRSSTFNDRVVMLP